MIALSALACIAGWTGCTRSNSDSPAVAPARANAGLLPNWFGARDVPVRRIGGKLFGDRVPLAGTVHLRIDVPDPSIWSGMERVAGADGRFDFGEVRSGRYSVLAISPSRTSRLIAVDTTTDAADALEVHAYPCRPSVRRILSTTGRPVARANIDIGGVVVATTDSLGRYTLCVSEELFSSREPILAAVRASEYATKLIQVRRDAADIVLDDGIVIRGTIRDQTGAPVRDVAVQPVHAGRPTSHSRWLPVPLQAVTNAAGRFEIRNVPKRDTLTDVTDGKYDFRLIMGPKTLIHVSDAAGASLSKMDLSMSEFVEEGNSVPNARISGWILHHGKPLPDTIVGDVDAVSYVGYRQTFTRSRMDGSFDLPVVTDGSVYLFVHSRRGLEILRKKIAVSPGQHLRDLTIELPDEVEADKSQTPRQ